MQSLPLSVFFKCVGRWLLRRTTLIACTKGKKKSVLAPQKQHSAISIPIFHNLFFNLGCMQFSLCSNWKKEGWGEGSGCSHRTFFNHKSTCLTLKMTESEAVGRLIYNQMHYSIKETEAVMKLYWRGGRLSNPHVNLLCTIFVC